MWNGGILLIYFVICDDSKLNIEQLKSKQLSFHALVKREWVSEIVGVNC